MKLLVFRIPNPILLETSLTHNLSLSRRRVCVDCRALAIVTIVCLPRRGNVRQIIPERLYFSYAMSECLYVWGVETENLMVATQN